MGLGERAKPSNSSVSTTRIRPLSGPHWPWMLLQALSALRSGPRLQHLVQLHIRTDCGPQGHQLKNPSTVVHAQFARLQLSHWDRHRGTQCASVRCSIAKCALSPAHPCNSIGTLRETNYVLSRESCIVHAVCSFLRCACRPPISPTAPPPRRMTASTGRVCSAHSAT